MFSCTRVHCRGSTVVLSKRGPDQSTYWVKDELSQELTGIRGFPDHTTFREKGEKLACADMLGVFLSLTQCNKANFDPLQ